jgi:GNAT superfamily N-acetyltransferase
MSCSVRAARAGDRPALAEIYRRSSLSNAGDRPHLLEHPDALELPWSDRAAERTRVAIEDGRIVGFATVETDGDHASLEDLFVDPASMRRGIATALLDDVVAAARARGVSRLDVTANSHALEFYVQAGFRDTGVAHTRFGAGRQMHLELGT